MSRDRSWRASCTCCVIAALLFSPLAFGCGPRHVLPPPDTLPKSIGERLLWNTRYAYIYATREAVAGETEAWVDTLTSYVKSAHNRSLGKGLLIVLDEGEDPLVPSLEAYVRLQDEFAQRHPRANIKQATLEERRAKLKEGCISEDAAIRLFAIRPDVPILARLGLPHPLPTDIAWVMSCPSHKLMEAEMGEIAPALIEKKKGKAFRVMTAWAIPLAVPEAAKAFRLARDDFAFRLWCARQNDWTPEECLTAIEAHMAKRARQISPYLKANPEGTGAKKDGKDEGQ